MVSRPHKISCVFLLYLIFDLYLLFRQQALPIGMDQKREYLFKVLVIGELATGKTALVKRYVHNFFSEHYRATVKILVG